MDLTWTKETALGLGLGWEAALEERLKAFAAELYRRNETTNLTRVAEAECDVRHFADSLLVAEFCGEGDSVLDIGPGPGFPSWVLAACRPDLQVTAVESQGKMVRMLTALPLPNLAVLEQRAEEEVLRERFDVVTGRAVAPFAVQAEVSAAWVAVGGIYVPFRTPSERGEVEAFNAGVLGLVLEDLVERALPGSETVRLFPVFRKVRATPMEYPRAWGRIKAKPLGGRGGG